MGVKAEPPSGPPLVTPALSLVPEDQAAAAQAPSRRRMRKGGGRRETVDVPPFALGTWLPWNGMTVLEETELPSLALAPTPYIAVRNHMLKKWHNDPTTWLSFEAASASAPFVFDDAVISPPSLHPKPSSSPFSCRETRGKDVQPLLQSDRRTHRRGRSARRAGSLTDS